MADQVRHSGFAHREIADFFGVSYPTLRHWVQFFGIPWTSAGLPGWRRPRQYDKESVRLIWMAWWMITKKRFSLPETREELLKWKNGEPGITTKEMNELWETIIEEPLQQRLQELSQGREHVGVSSSQPQTPSGQSSAADPKSQ